MHKLLIVEDEPVTRRILANHPDWAMEGITHVKCAENGREGLALMGDFSPDLIITDVKMPALNGIGMIHHIEKAATPPRIIIVSAYSEPDIMQAAIRLHVFDYIQKPINFPELMASVRRALGRPVESSAKADLGWDFSDLLDHSQSSRSGLPMDEHVFVKMVKELIYDRYADPELGIPEIAEHFHYTNSYACTLFKKHAGTTINDFLTNVRIEQAKKLLRASYSLHIHEITGLVGFSDETYFSKVFKKLTGMSPKAYRLRGK